MPDHPLALDGVSAATLRMIASALRSGRLAMPVNGFALSRIDECPRALATDLERMSAEGISAAHLTTIVELAADIVEARLLRESSAELVWSGPESPGAQSRDTLAVIDELFSSAQRSVLVSTFVVQQPRRVFATLGARLDAHADLHARIFLHVDRKTGDTRVEAGLLDQYARGLSQGWPGKRRPEVFYDPRGLSVDADVRATWHAKCVVVDDDVAFVTSANFTEWAQQRNVEAGALIRSRHFARQLRGQLESLIDAKRVRRLPGF